MKDEQFYSVEYDCVSGTWDIYFNIRYSGYHRFHSEHYDEEEAYDICRLLNSKIHK